MIQVAKLTEEQKDSLIGKEYIKDCYFNPIQDNNDNWIISIQEQEHCNIDNFLWVKDLTLINYEPKEE
tara:strand:- start:7 stop:210 length:204 start_codon:yes stop_codon:yes gene_type:complete